MKFGGMEELSVAGVSGDDGRIGEGDTQFNVVWWVELRWRAAYQLSPDTMAMA